MINQIYKYASIFQALAEETEPDPATLIIDTYFDFTLGKTDIPVAIGSIRDALPSIAEDDFNDAMLQLIATPGVIIYPEDNPRTLQRLKLDKGELNLNGAKKHWIKLEPPRPR